ncbi:hypothetical protein MXD58_013565, partial [Frankia sp. AgKG'84/4]|nr:hypothetical protein [Frankia sp. AgKG'84/4]
MTMMRNVLAGRRGVAVAATGLLGLGLGLGLGLSGTAASATEPTSTPAPTAFPATGAHRAAGV